MTTQLKRILTSICLALSMVACSHEPEPAAAFKPFDAASAYNKPGLPGGIPIDLGAPLPGKDKCPAGTDAKGKCLPESFVPGANDEVCQGITDPNLLAAVRSALELKTGQKITTAIATKLVTLDASAKDIQSLAGIDCLVKVKILYLNDNPALQDLTALIQLSTLQMLKAVHLKNNPKVNTCHIMTLQSNGVDVQTTLASLVCGPSGAICGDGKLDGTEQCDDGNIKNGDGCTDKCKSEVPPEQLPPVKSSVLLQPHIFSLNTQTWLAISVTAGPADVGVADAKNIGVDSSGIKLVPQSPDLLEGAKWSLTVSDDAGNLKTCVQAAEGQVNPMVDCDGVTLKWISVLPDDEAKTPGESYVLLESSDAATKKVTVGMTTKTGTKYTLTFPKLVFEGVATNFDTKQMPTACVAGAWSDCKTATNENGKQQCKSDGNSYGICQTFCDDPIGAIICETLKAMKKYHDEHFFGDIEDVKVVNSLKVEIMDAPTKVEDKIDFVKLHYGYDEKGKPKAVKVTKAGFFGKGQGAKAALEWSFDLAKLVDPNDKSKKVELTLHDVQTASIVLVPKIDSGSLIVSFPITGIRVTAILAEKDTSTNKSITVVTYLDPCWTTTIEKNTANQGQGPEGEKEGGAGNRISLNKERVSSYCVRASVDKVMNKELHFTYNNINCSVNVVGNYPCSLSFKPSKANTPEWFYSRINDAQAKKQDISKAKFSVSYPFSGKGDVTLNSFQNWLYKPGSAEFINDNKCLVRSKSSAIKLEYIDPKEAKFKEKLAPEEMKEGSAEECEELKNRWPVS